MIAQVAVAEIALDVVTTIAAEIATQLALRYSMILQRN